MSLARSPPAKSSPSRAPTTKQPSKSTGSSGAMLTTPLTHSPLTTPSSATKTQPQNPNFTNEIGKKKLTSMSRSRKWPRSATHNEEKQILLQVDNKTNSNENTNSSNLGSVIKEIARSFLSLLFKVLLSYARGLGMNVMAMNAMSLNSGGGEGGDGRQAADPRSHPFFFWPPLVFLLGWLRAATLCFLLGCCRCLFLWWL
ncbi:hypothetical protein SLA2020_335860 [Shorea laevis]